ncbi:MAG: hypothetical protein QOF48_3606 [Verrucomicrobiota bacterium]|jgi:hypothetical protein
MLTFDWRKYLGAGMVFVLAGGAVRTAGAPDKNARPVAKIDFVREIRPILSDNCFACHGQDENQRKSKLRLDVRETATQPAKSGDIAIVPGSVSKSKLIERILSHDPDEIMPPPKSKKILTPAQMDLLKRWIAEGADYKMHWAFIKPERPAVPVVENSKSKIQNPVDAFVLARLAREKLNPSPEADRVGLIRRVTLDLTGLPPTPAEVDAFVADKKADAYDRVVDRLLKSPRYGEHMARYWLDAARYADSHGFHIDSERSVWKYRDWVVDSFNKNMPFDQFTVEQLAGDLLPEPTVDQKIGSGFVRCNMSTGEGGAIVEEYQAKYTFDRVETTATMWMGLTLTCARCHTHKYDPIQNREYYGLYAFFNNLNESVMDGNKPNPDPIIRVPAPEQTVRQAELKKLISGGQTRIDAPMPALDQAQADWQARWNEKLSAGWNVLEATRAKSAMSNGATLRVLEDKSILAENENPESDTYEIRFKPGAGMLAALRLETVPSDSLPKKGAARSDDGRFRLSEFEAEWIANPADTNSKPKKLKFTQAVADTSEAGFEIAKAVDGKADTGWGVAADAVAEPHVALFALAEPIKVTTNSELRATLRYDASKSRRAIGHFKIAAAQNDDLVQLLNPPRLEPWQVIGPFKTEGLQQGFTNIFAPEKDIDFKKAYAGVREEIKWKARAEFEDGKANQLVQDLHGIHGAYYLHRTLTVPAARKLDVALRADDALKLWVNGKLVAERPEDKPGAGLLRVSVDLKKGENKFLFKVVTVQGAAFFTFDPKVADAETVPADMAAILATTKKLSGAQQLRVRNYYRREHSADFKKTFDEVEKAKEEESAIDKAIPSTLVAKEADKMRETFMLVRGEYDRKGDKVPPGLPAIFPPLPAGAPTNRLGLAMWLISPDHPLTARVTMNRFWQQYFGVGLVKTTEDFGVQSEAPSHPELLDWLATEFVRSGWDVKRMQRLIVTSGTYRQSSKLTADWRVRDPENRLLARGPRFRADGEVVRDTALFVSGLLSEKRGGRSAKPFEPGGLWEAVSFNNSQKYVQDKGDGNYRRSLYTYWKRQSPPPNMLIFDAPTREYCVVRRPRTNTPLQALVLLNDPQFVEASRAFGQRILREGGTSTASRIGFAFRQATGRLPGSDELKVLEDVYKQQLAAFRKENEAARKLLSVGAFQADSSLDQSELAAWSTIASMILNLDETVTKG